MHDAVADADKLLGQPELVQQLADGPQRRSWPAPGMGRDAFSPLRFQSSDASGEPRRWAIPETSSFDVAGSMTANFADEDPQLSTRYVHGRSW